MKYNYENSNEATLIKNYRIKNNKIIVTFTDSKTQKFDYSKELENKIIIDLLDQAKRKDAFYDGNEERTSALSDAAFRSVLGGVPFLATAFVSNGFSMTTILCLLATTTSGILYSAEAFKYLKKQEEYEKYHIYLSTLSKWEKLPEKIKERISLPSINTIDELSIDYIKQFERKLNAYIRSRAIITEMSEKDAEIILGEMEKESLILKRTTKNRSGRQNK